MTAVLPLLDNLNKLEPFFSSKPAGLITDLDGTISRAADDPKDATISDRCRAYLEQLTNHLPLVAALSERPVEEARRLVGVERMVYIGNHGLERWAEVGTMMWTGAQAYTQVIPKVLESLREAVGLEGIALVDKGISASVHYGAAPDRALARKLILNYLSGMEERGLLVKEGRRAIEIRPDIPVHKGTAVMALAEEYALKAAICLGDDLDDADASDGLRRWKAERRTFGAAVVVLSHETPQELLRRADYALDGVEQVEEFLGWLCREIDRRSE